MQVYFANDYGAFYTTYTVSTNIWLHHVITWDRSKVSVHVNGRKLVHVTKRKRRSIEIPHEPNPSERKRRELGNSLFTFGGHGFKIDADYDNVLFWNRVLNDTEATVMFYRDLEEPVIDFCKSTASSICLFWSLRKDPFNRIQKVSLSYKYLYMTDRPLRMGLNVTSDNLCIGKLGSLTTYVFTIEAIIGARVKILKSKEFSCRTTDGIPNPPKLSVGEKTSTSIEAIFKTPSPTNGSIFAYSMLVKENSSSTTKHKFRWNAKEQLPGTNQVFKINVTKLTPSTVYAIEVRAISELGESLPAIIIANTEGIALPKNCISVLPLAGGKMRVTWKLVANAVSYKVYLQENSEIKKPVDVFSNSTELVSLKPITEYAIDIRPVFKWGLGPGLAAKFHFVTPDHDWRPKYITAASIAWDKIYVRWTASTMQNVNYVVYLRNKQGLKHSVETKNNYVIFESLKPLTIYTVDIQVKFLWGLGRRVNGSTSVKTKDLDECNQRSTNRCDKNADCFNTEGSYLCQCEKGFVGDGYLCRPTPQDAKKTDFCAENSFRDVQWPRLFKHGTAVRMCPNGTVGFASRKCLYSVTSQQAVYDLPNLSDCVSKDVMELGLLVENSSVNAVTVGDQLKKVTTRKKLYGGDVKRTASYYQKTIRDKLKEDSMVDIMGQPLLDVASNLLNRSVVAAWKDLTQAGRSEGASSLFEGLEKLAEKISNGFTNSSFREGFTTPNVGMQIQRVGKPNEALNYNEAHPNAVNQRRTQPKISLPTNEILSQKGGRPTDVIFISYQNVDRILGIDKKPNEQDKGSVDVLNSKVVSASIVGAKKTTFASPVVLVLPHLNKQNVINTSCVFWNISTNPESKWLDTGCYVNSTSSNETVCHCYHLTNFAVLMTVSTVPALAEVRGHGFALRVITIIGLTISLIAMSIAFLTFCCFRFLRGPRTTYHRHLVASLILANLLFLFGVDKTENKMACSVIAVFLHYFFVVAFVWMAMEGILLYFMLKKIFSSRNFLKRKRCLVLCWVLPAIYVALLASLKIEHYGSSNFCWISRREGFIWSFVAPVSLALLVNFTVMGFAFQVMADKRSKGPDDGTISDVWYWLKGCLVLTCLLGVTWLVGVFYIDSNTVAFAYIFTILNALQGLFIFIFHCLIDSRVRSEYMRLIKCQKRYEYNEKAGYSSSMKMRKLSGSIKSFGSLDRSLSHSSAKRTLSNSLDRSLLRQHNGSLSEYARLTMQRSISSTKSDKSEKSFEDAPEAKPLILRSYSIENRPVLPSDDHVPSELHLHDEKAGSSYSSVFDSEIGEKPRQSQNLDVRDSLCLTDHTVEMNTRRWNTPTHGSDSGVSVRSELLQGDSFESNSEQRDLPKHTRGIAKESFIGFHFDTPRDPPRVVQSQNSTADSLQSFDNETVKENVITKTKVEDQKKLASKIEEMLVASEPTIVNESIQTCSYVDDKRMSINFDNLTKIVTDDDETDEDVFEVECKTLRLSQTSPVRATRMIQFEVEELPKVEVYESLARCGSPDKKERAETSLRIGIPKLISISSIESEPISPIIISINPEDREFSMLEAEIQFPEDTASVFSESDG
ncbi:uncharacterized protein LOC135694494 isoform X2 [Rhopilema esculentum]